MNEIDTPQLTECAPTCTLLLEVWKQPAVTGKWIGTVKLAGRDEAVPTQLLALLRDGGFRPKQDRTTHEKPGRSDQAAD